MAVFTVAVITVVVVISGGGIDIHVYLNNCVQRFLKF